MASSATQHQAPPGSHTPLTPSQGLLVGVHVFGEIQVDEAGVGSMDQGSKELPGWGCEPCGGGPRGAAAPHTARGWRGTEGRLTARTPCMVLTASKGQSVPARLRWESEWQWRRRLCRLCEQTALSSFAPESHPAPCSPGIPAPACLLPPAEHRVNPAHRNPLSHGIHPCSRWHLPHSHKGMSPGCPQLLPGRQGGVAAMTSPSLGCCRAGHRPEETKATQATLGTESE